MTGTKHPVSAFFREPVFGANRQKLPVAITLEQAAETVFVRQTRVPAVKKGAHGCAR